MKARAHALLPSFALPCQWREPVYRSKRRARICGFNDLLNHLVGKPERPRFRGTGFMECDAETGGSICLDACELHHLAPFLGFVGDELCEVGGRARQRLAEVSQTDLHLGVGEGRVDLLVELLDDLGWRVPRRPEAERAGDLLAGHGVARRRKM